MTTDLSSNRLDSLVSQLRWVTRMSVALSSAVSVEDVYSVLLSGLVSPLGLGFSRALVFEYESSAEAFQGKMGLCYGSPREYAAVQEELENELRFLEQRREEYTGEGRTREESLEALTTLELGSQWVTLSQRLGNEFSTAVQDIRFPLTAEHIEDCDLFPGVLQWKRPRALTKKDCNLPSTLGRLLGESFAALPLRTSRGVRAVILLDRSLAPRPIANEDLEFLEWFATQGALALQSAELISDLEGVLRELRAVDQLKSNFLSIISHELRTPLTAITGFVDLLLSGKVGGIADPQRALLSRVSKNTGHLNNMVNDLIEIAEIKADGMSELTIGPVDPLNTLFTTLPKLEFRRRDHHVEIDPVFQGVVPNILCDQHALERIYFHLLDNAVKFSPLDDVVTVEFVEESDRHLAISIVDRGDGIPKDKLNKIFDEFYQIDNSLTRPHEGLGLGLAVTRILVQSTRGDIRVESTVGKGSKFTLVYPIAPGKPDAVAFE